MTGSQHLYTLMDFKLVSDYQPRGDQGTAIQSLVRGLHDQEQHQVLLGVTGSGKTFTMAKVIESLNRPALIMAHNKTLAAQLYHEFKNFFPHNAVEYFVSYYDYYQPEAYVPAADLYIEKESTINDELDKLRLSATRSLFERRDVLIVSSVSCIYGLGSPEAYYGMLLFLEKGQKIKREDITRKLVDILYERTDGDFRRGTFRVRGDVIEIFPTYDDMAYRIELWGDQVETLSQIDPLFGTVKQKYARLPIYPKTHYVMKPETRTNAVETIKEELAWWEKELENQGRLVESQRVHQRTMYDLEMIKAMGFCHGIENYSRHFTGRLPGEPPPTLLDYFPRDFLMFIDESHQTVPQLHGMHPGDRARKENLVEYGFRLPSALDNRPLTFEEFEHRANQLVYVSATPGPYELTKAAGVVVEQIIRPTGLIDPPVEIRPVKGQIDDLLHEIRDRVSRKERVLVTTLTKRMSEDLAEYYAEVGVKVRYLHSEIETLERVKILRDLRKGEYDVLIGINLLREGLDLPEVSLVAILDADKEGFLRSAGSLIQTIGRCARNLNGRAVLYADRMTDSMKKAINETDRRRAIQAAYNVENNITPESIIRPLDMTLARIIEADYADVAIDELGDTPDVKSQGELDAYIAKLESDMRESAKRFEFEKAAKLRDTIKELRTKEFLFA
jgi:excinuclease ABC subunit B